MLQGRVELAWISLHVNVTIRGTSSCLLNCARAAQVQIKESQTSAA